MPEVVRRRLGWFTSPWFDYNRATRLGPWGRNYLLTHPEDLRWVLVSQADHYPKDARVAGEGGQQREGRGIMTSQGSRHKTLRTRFAPAYAQAQQLFLECAERITRQALEQWPADRPISIVPEVRRQCLSVLLEALFGTGSSDDRPLRRAIRLRQLYYERLWHWKLPFRHRLPLVCGFGAAQHLLEERLGEQARQRQHRPTRDLFSMLLQCTDSPAEAIDEARTFIAAGHDATAESLIWTLALLGRHPQHQEWNLARAENAEASLYESLRLYPPTWLYGRFNPRPGRLPSGDFVPEGANLLLCPYLQHRHPEYFERPEDFLPERFHSPDWRSRWRHTYYPFGFGPHLCLGEKIARGQILAMLDIITTRRRWQLDKLPDMRLGFALRPAGPLSLRMEVR